MDISRELAGELGIKLLQAQAVIRLIDEGNTIPFIARYRKEQTGGLNDEILRSFDERLKYLRKLAERREQIEKSLGEQEVLNTEIEKKLDAARTLVELEDIYQPYRPKRRTRGMAAREKGLAPLAEMIRSQKSAEEIKACVDSFAAAGMDTKEAVDGALDIIAEDISDDTVMRGRVREIAKKSGMLSSRVRTPDADAVFEQYYDFSEPVRQAAGHRVLAVNRGEAKKVLSVKIEAPEDALEFLKSRVIKKNDAATAPLLLRAVQDSYQRLLWPAVERDIRSELTEKAMAGAITVFKANLRQLLMQPPFAGQTVLGWDPAFRTGCKLAVADPTGKILKTEVIFPTAPQNRVEDAKRVLLGLVKKYGVTLISLGNGTASRESEKIIADFIRENRLELKYVIVNEAGASVYSASRQGTEEFPEFDVGQRSSASIARRLQDPLAELVKIDPASVGVGQYQHDCEGKELDEALRGVVEDCVNSVGVDLNTASAALLGYVSGLSAAVAKNIVAYREENGRFLDRKELLKVKKLGPKAYEQCAGFLRIRGGKNALDETAVHPESYPAARAVLSAVGCSEDMVRGGIADIRKKAGDAGTLAERLGIGRPTLEDILTELEKPGRDPRSDIPVPLLKSDVLELSDLEPGMELSGTVRNIVDFGAFVDIGVHQDGLVHISKISKSYIKHPLEILHVGDIVKVKVLAVDAVKKRISLTMLL